MPAFVSKGLAAQSKPLREIAKAKVSVAAPRGKKHPPSSPAKCKPAAVELEQPDGNMDSKVKTRATDASKSRKKDTSKNDKDTEKKNDPKASKKRKTADASTPSVTSFFAGGPTEAKPKASKRST